MTAGPASGTETTGELGEPLLTPRFATIVAAALTYFLAFFILVPVLPRHVEDELGGGSLAVGLVGTGFAISALIVRPSLGRLGDRRGRRLLFVGGTIVSGLSILPYAMVDSIAALVVLRLIGGVGEAAAFVGAATATQDLAPDHRRGEATSLFSFAIYGGIGLGPIVGEWLWRSGGFELVVTVAVGLMVAAALLGLAVPAGAPATTAPTTRPRGLRGVLHPASVAPGIILASSLIGFVGFVQFLAPHVDRIAGGGTGSGDAGPAFVLYAAIVLFVRLFFAKLPDRLGARRGGTVALSCIATGLAIIAAVPTLVGVFVGTAVLAFGVAFNYPTLFLLVMDDTDASDRSHAVASFGFFFDLPNAVGGLLLGGVIQLAGNERVAYALGSLFAAAALVRLRQLTSTPTLHR